jgi:hypothetical protein
VLFLITGRGYQSIPGIPCALSVSRVMSGKARTHSRRENAEARYTVMVHHGVRVPSSFPFYHPAPYS